MKHVLAYLKSRGGYGTMRDMKAASIQTREIAQLLKEGTIEKIKPGLYRLAVFPKGAPFRATLIDVCEAMPKGVICLLSALDFHELTTFNPSEVYVAIPHARQQRQVDNVERWYIRRSQDLRPPACSFHNKGHCSTE